MKYTAKRSLRVAIALLVCLVMMSSFFAPVFAWYMNKLSTKVEIESGIVGSYFEQGNGTEDMPYVIARPIQLYYFAWLQNLGYFDDDNPSSTTSDKKFYFTLGANIDMSENAAYSVLPPIGTLDHPFVGVFDGKYHYAPTDEQGNPVTDQFDPNNTIEGTYHTITNVTISNDDLSNVPQNGDENMQFIGLFGVVGSMTNHSATGTVKNFGIHDVIIETKAPLNDKTIIGIVAGYCNGIFEGIGVSNCKVKVKNGVTPADVTTYNIDDGTSSNVTPGMISFSLVGFSDQTYQAYNISPIAGGNEFGGSLAMESIYDKITAARTNANTTNTSYYVTKLVEIDADGGRTETYSNEINLDYHRSMANFQNIYFMKEYERTEDGEVAESITAIDRYSNSTTAVISDGLGNYLQAYYSGGTYALRNTTDFNSATKWTMATSNSSYRFAATVNNATRYLNYSDGLVINTTNTYNWTITNTDTDYQDYLIKTNSGNNYITFDRESDTWTTTTNTNDAVMYLYRSGGSTVTQYTYLNGGKVIQKKQAVTTITHTRYDAYLIQDGDGNYLVATAAANGAITSTTNSANATAWRFSNGASGGTFSIQSDDETTYYLYNNNGTLTISTSPTSWTVSNGQISSGGYYLMYLDGAWKVLAETTYYSIDDGNGAYLNFANNNLTGGASSTTRWHIDANNKIYTYNGTTKTYLYNNNGTLTTTTTTNTATAWTVNNTTHTISAGGYYLMYLDGAWKVLAETTYYSISNGNGTYLNFANNNLTGGASSTTRWHIDANNKIYTYNGTTKTYLYNNNGTLTTTTTANTASAWIIANGNITTGGYYLCYNDSTWGVKEETEYYVINNGSGNYLNLTNGNVATGTNVNATRWYFVGGKLYAYNGTTKTYLYNNNGVLATTTNSGTASNFVLDDVNHRITTGDYSLCYNDNAWDLKEEDGYYLINDGNNHYLNLTGSNIATGTNANATRWYISAGKIYAYNGTTKTYLYNNNGALATTTNSGTASTWTTTNNNIKTGDYYLIYEDTWQITTETSYYLISDGSGHYLNLTSGSIDVGTSLNATKWHFTNGASGGKIYTYVNGTATYIYSNAGSLATTTNSGTASTWTISNNQISTGGYYLVYQNAWIITTETSYYLISDGNGNYLNLTSSGYETGTSSNATAWHFSNGASGGKIYAYVNGTKTYMQNNAGTFGTTTTEGSATNWTVSSGQISNGGYNIVYSGGWLLTNVSSYYTLSDEEGHYLNLTSSGYSVGTSSNATAWQMTSESSGKIYTYINGTATYIYNNNGTLSTTTNSGTATTWAIDNTAKTISNNGYYLKYDGSNWILTNTLEYYISDGDGHYLNLNASSHLTEVGTSSNATEWTFTTSGNNYYISANANGTPYYLNYDTGNMVPGTTRTTTWTVSGSKIYCTNNSIEYDMFYDGVCWTIVQSTLDEYYIISNGTNYMGTNETTTSSWWGDETTYSIINQTVRSYAAKFTFASGVLTTSGGAITTNINGTTRYLYRSGNTNTTLSLNDSQGSYSNWCYNNSGGHQRIYVKRSNRNNYYYIRYNNGWTSLSSSQSSSTSNTYVLDGTAYIDDCSTKTVVRELPKMVGYSTGSYNFTNNISSSNYDLTNSTTNNNYNLTANVPYTAFNKTANAPSAAYNMAASTSSANYNLVANMTSQSYDITNQTEATTTIWKATTFSVETIDVKTKETYIPLATDAGGTTSLKNTGYIVSGSNYGDKETYAGDIRVSYYAISGNLTNALNGSTTYNDSRLEVVTRTYLSNGFKRISDSHNSSNSSVSTTLSNAFPNNQKTSVAALGLEKYDEARNQLEETLDGQTNVFGLHFMDAQISASRLVNIEKATINGSTYRDYKMPQDCIDFNLSMKGSLNFFAGTYFPGNTAFFSLHRIFRTDGEIVSIREIDKIYGNPSDNSKNYIYKYTDEASEPTLPSGYQLMFDTSWIKNPTMVEDAVYYFEIPVNAGEYALGSVNGADGAYLMYLDIGASAQSLSDGTTLETAIKGIDFVTESDLATATIATTLTGISQSTPSSAVIILKRGFQGEIEFVISQVTVQGAQVLRISYTLSNISSKDYVLWTKADSSVDVVDSTVYT